MVTMPPYHTRRAWLKAFGLTASAATGLTGTVASTAIGASSGPVIAGVVALGLAALSFARPRALALPFRAWNRLAKLFSVWARAYLSRVCLYTVFPAVRFAGVSIELGPPVDRDSGWVPRTTLDARAYHGPTEHPSSHRPSSSTATYLRWARESDYLWAICLLPFLQLLRALEVDAPANDLAGDTYTLF